LNNHSPFKSTGLKLALLTALLSSAGCSPGAFLSGEAGIGSLGGAAVGSAVGAVIGADKGNMTANIAANGLIGAGVGLLGGAIAHGMGEAGGKKQEIVLREAKMIDENQKEIDLLRQEVDDSTKWGRAETKSWNERYLGEDPSEPYQGPSIDYQRMGTD
jgi:hypothetical protein